MEPDRKPGAPPSPSLSSSIAPDPLPEFRFAHSYTDPGWTLSAPHRSGGHRERAAVVNDGTRERVGQVFPILGACTLPTNSL